MPKPSLDRLITGVDLVDSWIDKTLGAIEAALNVTASNGIKSTVSPNGIHLSLAAPPGWQWAKSSASGIPAMSGSTPGKATDVTLYDFNGTSLATQTVQETAYNLGSTAVGASKWLLLARIGKYWFVIWEDCS